MIDSYNYLITYITNEVVPPASGPGACGYHGVAQRGRGAQQPHGAGLVGATVWLTSGCGARHPPVGEGVCGSDLPVRGESRPASRPRLRVGPLVYLRGESGTTRLPHSILN